MNSQIREFEQNIIGYINQSTLPIEVKRLVIKDLFYQVTKTADDAVMIEAQMKHEQEAKKNQENQENKDIIQEEVAE